MLRLALWGPLGQVEPNDEPNLASIANPLIFEKLVSVDASGQLRPVLATRADRLPGGRVEIELRSGATFSDGSPVTVADVVRSLEPHGLSVMAEGHLLVVESRDRAIPTDALIVRAYVYRMSGAKFIGSGAFMVASHTEAELRLTRRNPQVGKLNEVRVIAYRDPLDAFAHTLKGDANAIVDLESRRLEFFHGVPSLQVVTGAGRSTDAILFNPDLSRRERLQLTAVLASERVRELAYGGSECAESRGSPAADVEVPPGAPLRVLSWGPFERLALAARRSLGDRGGEVSHLSPQETLTRVKRRDFDLVAARPLMWPPSALALSWRTGSPTNIVGYSNPAVDRALDAQDWAAAAQALRDDPPAAFICTRGSAAVFDMHIKNPRLGPYDILETLPEWEVAQ